MRKSTYNFEALFGAYDRCTKADFDYNEPLNSATFGIEQTFLRLLLKHQANKS